MEAQSLGIDLCSGAGRSRRYLIQRPIRHRQPSLHLIHQRERILEGVNDRVPVVLLIEGQLCDERFRKRHSLVQTLLRQLNTPSFVVVGPRPR